jgi:hypothetical protein
MDRQVYLPRVVVGGLIAGLIVNLGELAVNVWIFGSDWKAVLAGMGLAVDVPALVLWGAGSFVLGIVGVWIYVAISTRYGPGAGTAIRAGLAVWAIAFLVPTAGFLAMGAFPRGLIAIGLASGLVEVCLGVYFGAWLYREGDLAEA